jgi:hypothetical protein
MATRGMRFVVDDLFKPVRRVWLRYDNSTYYIEALTFSDIVDGTSLHKVDAVDSHYIYSRFVIVLVLPSVRRDLVLKGWDGRTARLGRYVTDGLTSHSEMCVG